MRSLLLRAKDGPVPALLLALLISFATTQVVHAQSAESARFTDRGRIMMDGAIGGRFTNTPAHSAPSQRPPWFVSAQPRVTYFLVDRVGIGLAVGGSFAQREDRFHGSWTAKARAYELWAGPDATIELPLVDKLSLLVLPGLYYMRVWRRLDQRKRNTNSGSDEEASVLDYLEYDAHFLRFSLRLPFVYHVSSSLAVGLGPSVWWDLFLSQDPPGNRIPVAPIISPAGGYTFQTDPYPRTRLAVGLHSWLGGSF